MRDVFFERAFKFLGTGIVFLQIEILSLFNWFDERARDRQLVDYMGATYGLPGGVGGTIWSKKPPASSNV